MKKKLLVITLGAILSMPSTIGNSYCTFDNIFYESFQEWNEKEEYKQEFLNSIKQTKKNMERFIKVNKLKKLKRRKSK